MRITLVTIIFMNSKLQGLNTKHKTSLNNNVCTILTFFKYFRPKKITLSLLSKTTKIKRHKAIVLQISENNMLIKYQKQWRMEIITEHKTQRLFNTRLEFLKLSSCSYHTVDTWFGWANKAKCTSLERTLTLRTKEDNVKTDCRN